MSAAANAIPNAEAAANPEAVRINIPGRLERLPMTAYQKPLFVIALARGPWPLCRG
ncbi:MAG: hypothetical protein WAK55_23985 [Xanthobacteraceae bacterium]